MTEKEFYNLEDIQKKLEISERTALRYLKSGELKGFKMGREWRFTQSDIDAFVELRRRKTEADLQQDAA